MVQTRITTSVLHGDLTGDFYDRALAIGRVAWDIETSGLDWSTAQIGTCQVAIEDQVAVVVVGARQPKHLAALLEEESVQKVFHHAPFDLRFMAFHWKARPANIACTKVASKILNPDLDSAEHSLKPVLQRHLGVAISKEQQVSDWLASNLTQEQIDYAAADVQYLIPLLDVLASDIQQVGQGRELAASFKYLPTRALLDIRGAGDVFAY